MKIKKYEVSDMKEALKLIKQDLGSDAVILSTRKIMKSNNFGLFARPILEVTAAVDYKPPQKQQPQAAPKPPAQKLPMKLNIEDDNGYATYQPAYVPRTKQEQKPAVSKPQQSAKSRYSYGDEYGPDLSDVEEKEYVELATPPRRPQSQQHYTEKSRYVEPTVPAKKEDDSMEKVASIISSLGLDKFSGLINDIGDIKKQLSEMKMNMSDNMVIDLPTRLKEYYTVFTKNGVDDVISYRFLKSLEKRVSDNLSNIQIKSAATDLLSELIVIEPDHLSVMKNRIIALAGPTGVGKTTTIAKVAANMTLKHGLKVCLITVDNFRIGAVEQLKTYAEIVNLPLYVATSPDELKRVIREVRGRFDCILLDSMGRSQFDISQIKSMNEFFQVDDSISVALVLSMASNHGELGDTVDRYSPLCPEYLIFTKLDETRYFGPLINLPVKKKIPLLLVTTGQNVPDDIEVPNGKKIARRVLQEIPTLWSDK